MHSDESSRSAPYQDVLAIDPNVPLGLALTVQRLSLAETLKVEQGKLQSAWLKLDRAVKGLAATPEG